jgi:MFS family permease
LKDYLGLPRAVYVLCIGTFINRAGMFLVPFLTLYLVDELGLGVGFATVGMGVYGGGSIFGALLGGHLADRIGRRTVMLGSLLGGAAILRFFGDITWPPAILAAVAAFTVLAESYRPAASAMIGDLVGPHRRPHAFALMYVAINLGFTVGATVGGILATLWFTWLFWGDALTAAAYAAIILFLIPETLPSRKTGSAADDSWHEAPNAVARGATAPRFEALRYIAGDRTFVIFCLGALLCGLVFMQWVSTFPLYLHQRGIGADTYGRVIAINGLLIVVFQLPVASVVSRFHRGSVVALAAVVIGIGFGATGLATTVWHFALVVVISTGGELMQAPLMSSIVTDLAPVRLRARYLGVFSMCFSSATMLGAPLGGMVLSRWGGSHLWGGCVLVALIAAVLLLSIRGRLTPPDE